VDDCPIEFDELLAMWEAPIRSIFFQDVIFDGVNSGSVALGRFIGCTEMDHLLNVVA
jgi:hypothetical protein